MPFMKSNAMRFVPLIHYKKLGLFIVCLAPFLWMVYRLFVQELGAEPVDKMLTITGQWTLRFLLLTLAITTLRKLLAINCIQYRRMLGLFAFFYGVMHFLIYFVFEQNAQIIAVFHEALNKKYLFVGMLALLLMLPLAMTSTRRMMKRLGKRWFLLHRLVYVVFVLGVLHFVWLVKTDITEPVIYATIFIVVLALRRVTLFKRHKRH